MKYIHLRNTKPEKVTVVAVVNREAVQPRGGETIGWFVEQDHLYGIRVKCNKLDNYNRAYGRKLIEEAIADIACGRKDDKELLFVKCSEVVNAFRTHLFVNTHEVHDYDYPGLEFRNIPFSFINSYVIGMFHE